VDLMRSGNVPISVLEEWVQTLGCSSLKSLNGSIYNFILENNKKLSSKNDLDLSAVAQFINPHSKWKKKDLLIVWDRLKSTLKSKDELIRVVETSNPLKAGFPSSTDTKLLPLTLLMSYCHHKKLWLPPQATQDIIVQYIQLSLWSSSSIDSGMSKALLTMIHHNSSNQWINTWNFLSHRFNEEQIDNRQNLKQQLNDAYYTKWHSRLFTIDQYYPSTSVEAILVTAMHYGLDFSHIEYPLREYMNLVLSLKNHASQPRTSLWGKIDYSPTDIVILAWIKTNNKGISLLHNYNPIYPIDIYPAEVLTSLAIMEGKNANLETSHMIVSDFLEFTAKIDSFRVGIQVISKNDITPVRRDDVSSIPNEAILSFGSTQDGWTVTTWDEWFEYFSVMKEFRNILDSNKLLNDIAIYKLKLLSATHYPSLNQLIETIEQDKRMAGSIEYQFVSAYNKKSSAEKEIFETQFWILYYICMVIRCEWKEQPPNDISTLNKKYKFHLKELHVTDQEALDLLLHKWMEVWYERLPSCSEIGELPLMNYIDGKFIPSNDENQGLTINQRMKIIAKNDNIFSCIRVGSNWLLSTATYYMRKLNIPLQVSISEMERIS